MAKKLIIDFLGVNLIARKTFFSDQGSFSITHNPNLTPGIAFYQDSISILKNKNTLKGMHLQAGKHSQAKLVTVLQGGIIDFFVDLRKDSESYLDYGCIEIDEGNANMLFIPKGFAHGYITTAPNTMVSYKLDAPYAPEHELTILWNDSKINIEWPKTEDLHISSKDLNGLSFYEVDKKL